MKVRGGSTDVTVTVKFLDLGGEGMTGLAYDTTGLEISYYRTREEVEPITLVELTAIDDAHTDGGFIEIGNGEYRLDLPDAAVAAGVPEVRINGDVPDGEMITERVDIEAALPEFATIEGEFDALEGTLAEILEDIGEVIAALGTLSGEGDLATAVAAIKAKTDQMAFSVANRLNVNVKNFNDVAVIGAGTENDLWRGQET